jgi:hypothetical protein
MTLIAGLLTLVGGALVAIPTQACPLAPASQHSSSGGQHALSMTPSPQPLPFGQTFSLSLVVCDAAGNPFSGILKADARMPRHKHGMNYRPTVTTAGDGKFLLKGFLFHMPGLWRFTFDLGSGNNRDRIEIDHHTTP